MAKTAVKKRNVHPAKKKYASPFGIYWEKRNYLFLFLGFALLIVGYFVMSLGDWDSFPSLVISPIILFIAYILIFPASILYRKKETEKSTEQEVTTGKS